MIGFGELKLYHLPNFVYGKFCTLKYQLVISYTEMEYNLIIQGV